MRPSPCRRRATDTDSRDSCRGQATIEFALVVPVLALLLVGVVEVARVAGLQVATVDAARTGARAAAVDPRPGVAREAIGGGPGGSPWSVTTEVVAGPPRLVTVRVTRMVHLLPGPGWTDVRLEASSTMAVESDRSG